MSARALRIWARLISSARIFAVSLSTRARCAGDILDSISSKIIGRISRVMLHLTAYFFRFPDLAFFLASSRLSQDR